MTLAVGLLTDLLQVYPRVNRFVVAYSGGIDSTALLHLVSDLQQLQMNLSVRAIHINHGLHPDAMQWANFCQQQAAELAVPFLQIPRPVSLEKGESLESVARETRYQALSEVLEPGECLLLAQHQDDQMETFLLQALRGAGPAGLSAMARVQVWQSGWLARPFLACTRQMIEAFVKKRGLTYIEDPSNVDIRFDRNFLRHKVVPVLKQRWPAIAETISRSAQHCAESVVLSDEVAVQDVSQASTDRQGLRIDRLRALDPIRQRNVLRFWLKQFGMTMPPQARLMEIEKWLNVDSIGGQACVGWQGAEVRVYRQIIYAMPPLPPPPVIHLPFENGMQLPGDLGSLFLYCKSPDKLNCGCQAPLKVRFREGGESLKLPGRSIHQTLKKLCQAAGFPPWLRNRMPLVYREDVLIAVADQWLTDTWLSGCKGRDCHIVWQDYPSAFKAFLDTNSD